MADGGDYNLGTAHGTIALNASSLGRAASSLDHVANRLLLVGGAAVAGIGLAVKKAADFEQQLSRFGAVTNASEADMEKLRQKSLQLGRDSAYGATQIVEGFVELGKAGLGVQDILAGVGDAAVELAAAGELDMARSTEILVNTMRQFNLPASEAVNIANLLAGAANASTLEVDDLAVSLKYAGPVAAALNLPLKDVAATLAVLGNNGIKGSTAGTSLRGILISLTPTSLKAAGAMHELGLITEDGTNKFFDAEGRMKSLAEVSQILHDATVNLTDKQKKEAFTTIFQRRAMASAIVLAKGGAQAFDEMTNSQQFSVTAQEVMKKKLDNLNGSLKILKASFETFAITIGEIFTPFLKKLADQFRGAANWLIKLSPETKKWIGLVVGGTGGLLLFLGVILKLGKGVVGMYVALKDLSAALRIFGAIMKTTIAANPWILALVGIAAAIIYLWNVSPKFRQFVTDFLNEVGKWVVAIGDFISQPGVQQFVHDFLYQLGEIEVGIADFVSQPGVQQFVTDFLTELGRLEVGFADFMLKTFGSPEAESFLNDFLMTLGGVEVGFADFMLNTFGSPQAEQFLHDFLYTLGSIIVGIGDFGAKFLSAFGSFVAFAITGMAKSIADIATFLFNGAVDIITGLINGLSTNSVMIYNWIRGLPGMIWGWITDIATWLWQAGVDLITGLVNGIVFFVTNTLPGAVLQLSIDLVSAVMGLDPIGWLKQAGSDLMHGLWEGIKSSLGWLWEKLKNFAGDLVDKVLGFFGIGSPSKVFADMGMWMVRGLAKGVDDNIGTAHAALAELMPKRLTPSVALALGASSSGAGQGPGSLTSAQGVGAVNPSPMSTMKMEAMLAQMTQEISNMEKPLVGALQVMPGRPDAQAAGLATVRHLRAAKFRSGNR